MIHKKLYIISVSMLLTTYSSVHSADRRVAQMAQDAEIKDMKLAREGKSIRNPEGQSSSEAYREQIQDKLKDITLAVSALSKQNTEAAEQIVTRINTVSEELAGAVDGVLQQAKESDAKLVDLTKQAEAHQKTLETTLTGISSDSKTNRDAVQQRFDALATKVDGLKIQAGTNQEAVVLKLNGFSGDLKKNHDATTKTLQELSAQVTTNDQNLNQKVDANAQKSEDEISTIKKEMRTYAGVLGIGAGYKLYNKEIYTGAARLKGFGYSIKRGCASMFQRVAAVQTKSGKSKLNFGITGFIQSHPKSTSAVGTGLGLALIAAPYIEEVKNNSSTTGLDAFKKAVTSKRGVAGIALVDMSLSNLISSRITKVVTGIGNGIFKYIPVKTPVSVKNFTSAHSQGFGIAGAVTGIGLFGHALYHSTADNFLDKTKNTFLTKQGITGATVATASVANLAGYTDLRNTIALAGVAALTAKVAVEKYPTVKNYFKGAAKNN